jgi:hypothetical protein
VLASNRSSVPEAGGDLAVYYAPGDVEALVEALTRLSFDDVWRASLEERIRTRFRPRTWAEIGRQMIAALDAWAEVAPVAAPVPAAEPGRLHRFSRSVALGLDATAPSGEALRSGLGWAPPETWGCRARAEGAEIAFTLPLAEGTPIRVHLGLKAFAEGRAVSVSGAHVTAVAGHVLPGAHRWFVIEGTAPGPGASLRLALTCRPSDRPPTKGERIDVGVIGLMACGADDVSARADFQAGVASGGWNLPHEAPER